MIKLSKNQLAGVLESTSLKPTVTETQILALCDQAVIYHLFAVCVPPCWVRLCAQKLKSRGPIVVTVTGFPFGYEDVCVKAKEIEFAASHGAREVDYVMNISRYFSEGPRALLVEAQALSKVAKDHGILLKAIIETAVLSDHQKVEASKTLLEGGAHMIKTSTGTIPGGGAQLKDVMLLRKNVASDIRIKASGDIRTLEFAAQFVAAGVARIGTSHVEEIFKSADHGTSSGHHQKKA